MSTQFGRFAEVIAGTVKVDSNNLTVHFEVPFDDDTDPNESKIHIYNLTESTVNRIKRGLSATLNAGYVNDRGVVLSGFISKVFTTRDGVDKKTTIYVLDSSPIDEKKTIKKSYKANIKASQILKDLAAALKLHITDMKLPSDKSYAKGYSVNGEILTAMRKIAKDCGAIVYINKSKLYIRSLKAGDDSRFILKAETGLIGTPEPFEDERDGVKYAGYKVKCLLQYRLTTASIVHLQSKYVKGQFRVRSGVHKWNGNDFITEMEVIS
ncbi:phage protein [Mycobacteroides abscessus]|uniref:phage protein n=1 Tax=Mycobacteroides abscessus TaxID=36809 RepID=UPI000C2571DC